jgi:predicted transcriptional regulator
MDLRPYMIQRPFTVNAKDDIEKVHRVFRGMHLRQLIVVDHERLVGIITRQDLF